MDLVMFHSGSSLPKYLKYTFKQLRIFNPELSVYFLTNHGHLNDPVFAKYKIKVFSKNDFYSEKVRKFEERWNWPPKHFWTVTATRLIYIENLMKNLDLKNVYHIENDIMVYYDLRELHPTFKKLYRHMSITTGAEDKCMTGFMFIRNRKALMDMTQFFLGTLGKYRIKEIKKKYETQMVNEMTLMRAYSKRTPYLEPLPIMPYGEHSENIGEFKSIFDPASWGHLVAGYKDGVPGAKRDDAYIGQELIKNPEYAVIWKNDKEGKKVPYFKYDGKEVKINNLHIHSKTLDKYMSL